MPESNSCIGCDQDFRNEKNLTNHQKKCPEYDKYLCHIISCKCALDSNIESSHAAKQAHTTRPEEAHVTYICIIMSMLSSCFL